MRSTFLFFHNLFDYFNMINKSICFHMCLILLTWLKTPQNTLYHTNNTATVLKGLALSPFGWNITTDALQNTELRHILRGKIWQQVCVFLKREALCVDGCLQARPYLLQRGGCGQCWEALLMGWLVLVLGLCGMVGHCSCEPWVAKRLVVMQKNPAPVGGGGGYKKRLGSLECLKVSLVKFSQTERTLFSSTSSEMVKIRLGAAGWR